MTSENPNGRSCYTLEVGEALGFIGLFDRYQYFGGLLGDPVQSMLVTRISKSHRVASDTGVSDHEVSRQTSRTAGVTNLLNKRIMQYS